MMTLLKKFTKVTEKHLTEPLVTLKALASSKSPKRSSLGGGWFYMLSLLLFLSLNLNVRSKATKLLAKILYARKKF